MLADNFITSSQKAMSRAQFAALIVQFFFVNINRVYFRYSFKDKQFKKFFSTYPLVGNGKERVKNRWEI